MGIRILGFVFLLFIGAKGLGQNVLIPYKSGDKYGLCDSSVQIVRAPEYDRVRYLERHYFEFGNKEIRLDTMTGWDGKPFLLEQEHWSVGLMKENEIIIPLQNLEGIYIYEHFILLSESVYQPSDFYLYSLKGEKLLKKPTSFFYYNEPNHLGPLAEASTRYIPLSLYTKQDGKMETLSIAIYDTELQKIDSWLVKDVTDYEYDSHLSLPDLIYCTYQDRNGRQERYIHMTNGRYVIVKKSELGAEYLERLKNQEEAEVGTDAFWGEDPMIIDDGPVDMGHFPVMMSGQYNIYRDSLVYRENGKRKWVNLDENKELIYVWAPANAQSGPVMYKQEGKYGLLIKGEYSPVMYDSMRYCGSNFIAALKKGKQLRFGLLDGDGNVIVPFEYDSLYGSMKEFETKLERTSEGVNRYSIILQERQPGYSYYGAGNPYVSRYSSGILWDPLESTCRHASLSIL